MRALALFSYLPSPVCRVWLSSGDLRDVGEVQGGGGRKDVGIVFGAGLLEAVQRGVAVVFGQALVLMSFTGKLDVGVFGQRDPERFPMQPLAIQVAHGCKAKQVKGQHLYVHVLLLVISFIYS